MAKVVSGYPPFAKWVSGYLRGQSGYRDTCMQLELQISSRSQWDAVHGGGMNREKLIPTSSAWAPSHHELHKFLQS